MKKFLLVILVFAAWMFAAETFTKVIRGGDSYWAIGYHYVGSVYWGSISVSIDSVHWTNAGLLPYPSPYQGNGISYAHFNDIIWVDRLFPTLDPDLAKPNDTVWVCGRLVIIGNGNSPLNAFAMTYSPADTFSLDSVALWRIASSSGGGIQNVSCSWNNQAVCLTGETPTMTEIRWSTTTQVPGCPQGAFLVRGYSVGGFGGSCPCWAGYHYYASPDGVYWQKNDGKGWSSAPSIIERQNTIVVQQQFVGVYDITGKMLKDAEHLKNGVYIFRYNTGAVKKIILK